MYQTIEEKQETFALKVLADAVKSLDMTDKQIVTACRPKPVYYSTMTKTARRSCMFCQTGTSGTRFHTSDPHAPYSEPIVQLERHYMDCHAS